MAPKESHKTSPCLLAQLEKILRHFMGPGKVSERDTHRTTISKLDGKSTPLPFWGSLSWLVGWGLLVKSAVVLLLTSSLANGPNWADCVLTLGLLASRKLSSRLSKVKDWILSCTEFFLHWWQVVSFFIKNRLKGETVEHSKGTKYFKIKLSEMVLTSLYIHTHIHLQM